MFEKLKNWIGKLGSKKSGPIQEKDIKRLTALHEAAHVVTTYFSGYHSLVGKICINYDTTGETFVSLSKKKINAMGKGQDTTIMKDPEVVIDAAIIFYSGFEAEKIYCKKINVKPNISFSMNDYNNVDELINNADPSVAITKEKLIEFSNKIVNRQWNTIETVAEQLLQSKNNCLEAFEVLDILDRNKPE